MGILVLNSGSSSHKCALFGDDRPPLWQGWIDWTIRPGQAVVKVQGETEVWEGDRATVLARLLATLGPAAGTIQAVGHRVVHGGDLYKESVVVTAAVRSAIRDLIPLAPTHNPANLEGIELLATLWPGVPQVAVFDTAFHSTLPVAAAAYPIPYAYWEEGLRRYGFHGISHGYCHRRAADILGRADLRAVTCHLGNGCSLAAAVGGVCQDTTMGFTPLEGLMMGTRSGSIDPGLVLHWWRQGKSVAEVDRLLNRESGLKGIFGETGDLRQILAARSDGDPRAILAFDMFVHRLRAGIAAMAAALNGLEAVVFAGGMGENSPVLRAAVCAGLGFLGMALDATANENRPVDCDIATPAAPVRVLVIQTSEEWAIAQECRRLLA
ncbi:MAG TPA: acetate kinase [Cyanobacteria bacterium UBA8156]|jgi:acetate kinase|nr:acetate kinase [Cyanobacteria bacterium UBA8156]